MKRYEKPPLDCSACFSGFLSDRNAQGFDCCGIQHTSFKVINVVEGHNVSKLGGARGGEREGGERRKTLSAQTL